MAYEDPNDAPAAYSTGYYKCDGCENLHVTLLTMDENTIARCIISREQLVHMLEVIDGEAEEGAHKH